MSEVDGLDGLGVHLEQRSHLDEGLFGAAVEYPFGLALGVAPARLVEGQPIGEVVLSVAVGELPHSHCQPCLTARYVQAAHLSPGVLVDLGKGRRQRTLFL